MEFGMNNEEIISLTALAFTLCIGSCLGVFLCMIFKSRYNRALEQEVDKFRDLYFNELDKWKNKYDEDDYESYH
tara:strand:+ start:938 stop:1159 length:222 start_codon:yes stop_codon:yes gene_type:complete